MKTRTRNKSKYYEVGLFDAVTMHKQRRDGLADRDWFAETSTDNRKKLKLEE